MTRKTLSVPRSIRRKFPKAKHLYEMTKAVKVIVNEKDCQTGKAMDPSECALAKATCRHYHADGAVIGLTFSYVIRGEKVYKFKTSTSVQREIVSFDRHHDFAPGDYLLSPVPPTARREHGKRGPRGKPARKPLVHRTVRVRDMKAG